MTEIQNWHKKLYYEILRDNYENKRKKYDKDEIMTKSCNYKILSQTYDIKVIIMTEIKKYDIKSCNYEILITMRIKDKNDDKKTKLWQKVVAIRY